MASDPRLSTRERRIVLEQLPRDRVGALTTRFELDAEDRRSIESHIDATVRKRGPDFAVLHHDARSCKPAAGHSGSMRGQGGRRGASSASCRSRPNEVIKIVDSARALR